MIGLLGGTFDPIHHGHLRTALEVAEQFALERLHLLPGNVPPHRPQPVASAVHRLAMLQAAVAAEPRLLADDRELRRSGFSYTVNTLESFRAEFGADTPLLFVLGVDAFQHFQHWHRWQDILQLAHLVIAHRPGYALPPDGWYRGHVTDKPADLHENPTGRIFSLAVTALDISATAVRSSLQQGRSPRYLLPDSVLNYIQTHQLYM